MDQNPGDITEADRIKQMSLWQEHTRLALIVVLGLSLRLLFITFFPTVQTSDFRNLLDFAILFRDDGLAKNAWQWLYFPPGLPVLLSIILRFVHESPDTVARWTTAFITGLVPILPYLLWKDVLPLRTRMIAALLLALWPGQILFSSVLAQDNWIIFPTVAISVLAVRVFVVKKEDGVPFLSAFLYSATVAMRQEMMIVLLPATLIAILGGERKNWLRNLLVSSAIIGIIFTAVTLQRGKAIGSYSLVTQHLGKAILGAYVPGAGMGWIDPIPYAKAKYPELMKNVDPDKKLAEAGMSLAWQEFVTRPGFHGIRIFGSTLINLFKMDRQLVWWSLSGNGVLPPAYQKDAGVLVMSLSRLLQIYPVAINLLFACSLIFALSHTQLLNWITPLLATIVLKISLHAIIVSQPRYFLVVIALEILVISIVWDAMLKKGNWKLSLRSIILGIVSILILIVAMNYARDYIMKHDIVLLSDDRLSASLIQENMMSRHGSV